VSSCEYRTNVKGHSSLHAIPALYLQQGIDAHVDDPHFWYHITGNDYAPDIWNKLRTRQCTFRSCVGHPPLNSSDNRRRGFDGLQRNIKPAVYQESKSKNKDGKKTYTAKSDIERVCGGKNLRWFRGLMDTVHS